MFKDLELDSQATCLPDKFDSESDSGDYRTAVGYDNETNDRANSDVSDSGGSYDYYDQTGEKAPKTWTVNTPRPTRGQTQLTGLAYHNYLTVLRLLVLILPLA